MGAPRHLYGFHAVGVRLKTHPETVLELHVDASRRDARMRSFVEKAQASGRRLVESDDARLQAMVGTHRHQGVVARVGPLPALQSLDHTLDRAEDAGVTAPLVLALDGVTDPHNLGACLRVADGAGTTAVIAPRDHAVGVNATVAKVASGAAESVPYFMVTNLARSLAGLKDRGLRVVGTSDRADRSLFETDLTGPLVLVLGAEGRGLRQLTERSCDVLVHLPMRGAVESLNVSVAAGICLYEALRQREGAMAASPAAPPAP
jgi:23S rRNA (guanosine2251-2'-O)-methyltransferase